LNEEIKPLRIFIGWDSREDIAYQVCKQSILDTASVPVEIVPLKQKTLKKNGMYSRSVDALASTEFTFTRFLVPELCNFEGWALFIDCDMIFKTDIKQLFDQVDDKYAVMCAQHDYTPTNATKMDGQEQHQYPRKNWSSMVLFNCSHDSNKVLVKETVNDETVTGAYFHRFSWLDDTEVGKISHTWNWLVGWYSEPASGIPDLIHYTNGGPWFEEYHDCEYANDWYRVQAIYHQTIIDYQKKS
jgi:lipopolysaccharide biosynthesis glycosyltransferase